MIRPGIRRLFRLAFHRREDAERDVDGEVRLHLELRAEEFIRQGMAPAEAHAEAQRRFAASDGALQSLRTAAIHRETTMRHQEWGGAFLQDARYVLRTLRRSPAFTVTVALTLALGLGANAALFSLLDRMFLHEPAGVRDASHVHRIWFTSLMGRGNASILSSVYSYPQMRALANALGAGSPLAGYSWDAQARLGADAGAPRGVVTYVVGNYFGVLGIQPAAGRTFAADEYSAEAFAPVAVISHKLWIERFGGADVAGRTVDLYPHKYTIVGVAPEGFRGTDLDASDVWVPLNSRGTWTNRNPHWYESTGTRSIRLVVRVDDDARLAAITAVITNAFRRSPTVRDSTAVASLGSLREAIVPSFNRSESTISFRLAGVAVLILLIACANVANLLLIRALQRRREIALRLALGVSRGRLARQLLTEGVVLAVIGSSAAVLAAVWGATWLRAALLPRVVWGEPVIGFRVIAFTAVLALIAGLGTGLAPALQSARTDLTRSLRGGAREGATHRSGFRSTLLAAQIGLTVVLLVGAGLFVRSLRNVESVNTGYDTDRVLFAEVRSDPERADRQSYDASVLVENVERIGRMPGVERVALSMIAPMYGFSIRSLFLPDRDSVPQLEGMPPVVSYVSPGFFAVMGMRLIAGRDFSAADRVGAAEVVVVNAAMARTLWSGESALTKCVIVETRQAACRPVVGVISDAHYGRIVERPTMQFYVPLEQAGGKNTMPGELVIRAQPGRIGVAAASVRAVLAGALGSAGTPNIRTMSEQLAPELRSWRLAATLFSAAGLLALAVAIVGVYGTVAYSFSQRTHEIGVRIALGARGTNIVRLVLESSLKLAMVGVVGGIGISLWAGRFVEPLLYETSSKDVHVLATVAITLLAVAGLASLLPALKAKRVSPMEALRSE